jgi:hypothetical protein
MHSLVVEEKVASGLASLAGDITQQLRTTQGKVVLVCTQPAVLLSLVRKRWKRIERQLTRERASTVDATKILRLTQEIGWMQRRHFSIKASPEALEFFEADVVFATVDQLLRFAPECQMMYIACPLTQAQLHLVTAWMPKGRLVVRYHDSHATIIPF